MIFIGDRYLNYLEFIYFADLIGIEKFRNIIIALCN